MITITTDIFCDKCVNWIHACVGNTANRPEARKLARELGWTVKGRGIYAEFICPACNGTDSEYWPKQCKNQ